MSKRYNKLEKESKIDNIENLLAIVKKNANAKFDESIDISIYLNLKQSKSDNSLRTLVNLPHGLGKKIKVAVICENSKLDEAKESGCDEFGSEDFIEKILQQKVVFDKLVATPAMMSKMGKLGKILGPKGLMPNPKLGTVTNDLKKSVKALKTGQIEIKSDKDGNVATSIGKKSFTNEKLLDNYKTLLEKISKEKPNNFKGNFIQSCYLTSTMGTSFKIKNKAV